MATANEFPTINGAGLSEMLNMQKSNVGDDDDDHTTDDEHSQQLCDLTGN